MKSWFEVGFTLEKTQDGSPTLRRHQATRSDFPDGESMHHSGGAWAETLYIYQPVIEKIKNLKIQEPAFLSVGLGLGYVELLIAKEYLGQDVRISSFEIVPELREYFVKWICDENLSEEIQSTYDLVGHFVSDADSAKLKNIKRHLRNLRENKKWFIQGALEEAQSPFPHHGIMYDAFSKAVSPHLWQPDFVVNFLNQWGAENCVLSTYSCTGEFKRALKSAQFELQIKLGFKGKRNSTFAVREKDCRMNSKNTSVGFVRSIYISAEAGEPMLKVSRVLATVGKGLEGDRYASKTGFWQTSVNAREVIRDVSFINAVDIEDSGFSAAETRRNIIVQTEINLVTLIGKKFRVGEVLFMGVEECTPCKRPSVISGKPNFAQVFKNKGGLRAQVLKSGRICDGDSVILVDSKLDPLF